MYMYIMLCNPLALLEFQEGLYSHSSMTPSLQGGGGCEKAPACLLLRPTYMYCECGEDVPGIETQIARNNNCNL